MGYIIVGIIVIALVTVFTFMAIVRMLKNKNGNIIIDVGFLKIFKYYLKANWKNDNKEVHKNKKKKP